MGYGKATIVDDPIEKKLGADIFKNHYRKEWGMRCILNFHHFTSSDFNIKNSSENYMMNGKS